MLITKKDVFNKLQQYLNHVITLDELVSWAENVFFDAEIDAGDMEVIRDIVSRIGVSDVKSFGLTWEDCETFIHKLGYKVKLNFEFA